MQFLKQLLFKNYILCSVSIHNSLENDVLLELATFLVVENEELVKSLPSENVKQKINEMQENKIPLHSLKTLLSQRLCFVYYWFKINMLIILINFIKLNYISFS